MPTMDVDGATVSYTDEGSGETVVLLHSSASSGEQWSELRQQLAEGYRVLAPDLYGYGGTDRWDGRRPLRLADEAALVGHLMARLPGRVHLVGHSYGGAVALRLALEQSQRLATLTLIEPVAFHLLSDAGLVEEELLDDVRDVADAVSLAAAAGDYWGGMEGFIDFWNGPGAWSRIGDMTRARLCRHLPKIATDFSSTINEETPLEAYRRIDVPTLILCGLEGPLVTYPIAETLAQTLPRGRLAIIGGAGHMLPVTHPEVVNAAIVRHLKTNASLQEAA
jgi:pimeloyl-ACP methyl ester carboxylesterase